MHDKEKRTGFSVTIDGLKLDQPMLENIGDQKLAAMRDSTAETAKLSYAVAVCSGFMTVMNVASSIVAQIDGRDDYTLNEPASRIMFGAMTAAATLFAYKCYRERKLAKSLDQAVVVVNGDASTAKYKTTADELVKKDLFKKEQIADQTVYQRLTP